jgi:hypothetical protein
MGLCLRRTYVVALCLLIAGCHRVIEPASEFDCSDQTRAGQLLSGFWQIEEGRWRWTAREFWIALRPPDGADLSGATVDLQIFVPDAQIAKLGPMTLTAFVNGRQFGSKTFAAGGSYEYSEEVPKDALATSLLPLRFVFDKAAAPWTTDGRELAAVVSRVGLSLDR